MADWFLQVKKAFITCFIDKDRWHYITQGLGNTLKIALVAVLLGVAIGTVVAILRSTYDKNAATMRPGPARFLLGLGNAVCRIYLTVIRGTPVMIQILIMFFVIFSNARDGVPVAMLTFGINSGAYVAEIFRAGIQSIDEGQMEAGRSLGMTWVQTMRYIIVPQAFKRVIPPLGNEFIALLKDSSLVSVIGFEELTRRGQLIIAKTYGSLEIWISVAIVYLVMTLTISRFVAYLERRFATDDQH